ncbi:hypothetical protein H0H93_010244 [Arthromyces matolae]|nr:hypothetical protein H0H93_010244 [Arthromyces matolae]
MELYDPVPLSGSGYDTNSNLSSLQYELSGSQASVQVLSLEGQSQSQPESLPEVNQLKQQVITSPSSNICVETGVSIRMNSFDVPDRIRVFVPELNVMLRADIKERTVNYPPHLFITDSESISIGNVSLERFIASGADRLLMDTADLLPLINRKPPPEEPSQARCMLPIAFMNEDTAAKYLNDIICAFQEFSVKNPPRFQAEPIEPIGYWSAELHNKTIDEGPYRSKPDLMLLPVQNGYKLPIQSLIWPDIMSVGELTSSTGNTRKLQDTTTARSFLILYTQGDRDFATTFSINSKGFTFKFIDRQGAVTYGPMFYDQHTLHFFYLILSISYHAIGRDHTMRRKSYDFLKTPDNRFPITGAKPKYRVHSSKGQVTSVIRNDTGMRQVLPTIPDGEALQTEPIVASPLSPLVASPLSPLSPLPNASSQSQILPLDLPPQTESMRNLASPPVLPPRSRGTSPTPQIVSLELPPEIAQSSAGLKRKLVSSPVLSPRSKRSSSDKSQHSRRSSDKSQHSGASQRPAISIDGSSNLDCNIDTITCEDRPYKVLKELFRAKSLIGRATRVFIAHNTEVGMVIIKESWVLEGRSPEAEFLRLCNASQLPKVIGSATLQSTGTWRPGDKASSIEQSKRRQKRRLVLTPVCDPLATVRSLLEFLAAMLDYVIGIKYLKNNNRMHRDISVANLMLGPNDTWTEEEREDPIGKLLAESECRRGILIDFDYGSFILDMPDPLASANDDQQALGSNTASLINPVPRAPFPDPLASANDDQQALGSNTASLINPVPRAPSALSSAPTNAPPSNAPADISPVPRAPSALSSAPTNAPPSNAQKFVDNLGPRTGTAPFMAIPLLLDPAASHCVAFDLESLFYVMLYFALQVTQFQEGKDVPLEAKMPEALAKWFKPQTLDDLGMYKAAQFYIWFEDKILSCVTPLFESLKPSFLRMWKCLYPQDSDKYFKTPVECCDAWIGILQAAIIAEAQRMKAEAEEATEHQSKRARV